MLQAAPASALHENLLDDQYQPGIVSHKRHHQHESPSNSQPGTPMDADDDEQDQPCHGEEGGTVSDTPRPSNVQADEAETSLPVHDMPGSPDDNGQACVGVPMVGVPHAVQSRTETIGIRRSMRDHPKSFQHGACNAVYRDDTTPAAYVMHCPFHSHPGKRRLGFSTAQHTAVLLIIIGVFYV
jgi:hypothetical protein